MKKARLAIVAGIGVGLFAFQNCSGNMQAFQEFGNMQLQNQRTANNDASPLGAAVMLSKTPSGASCLASDLKLAWPLGGTPYQDWTIVEYVDDDPTTNILDFMGAKGSSAITYNAHQGVDIAVPDFRYMDNDFPVYAAAGGKVVEVYASSYDRNTSCSPDTWNHVVIKHPNGFLTVYGHLKQNSIVVAVGQSVVAGQKIGVVGSSGCSTGPHLHLEVRDCNKNFVDSMKLGMYVAPPVYPPSAPSEIMDISLKQPPISQVSQMVDPGADTSVMSLNQPFSVGLVLSNAKTTDVFAVKVVDPSGVQQPLGFSVTPSVFYPLSDWWGNLTLNQPGAWTLKFFVNGTKVASKVVNVQ